MKVKGEKFVYDFGEDSSKTTTRGGGGVVKTRSTTNKSNLFHFNKKNKESTTTTTTTATAVRTKFGAGKNCQQTRSQEEEVRQHTDKCPHDQSHQDHNNQQQQQIKTTSSTLGTDKHYRNLFNKHAKCSSYSDPNLLSCGRVEPSSKNLLCPPSALRSTTGRGGDCTNPGTVGDGNIQNLKKVITLWQNYYPEGGWGWIVLICAFIVQCLCHGTQLSFSIFSVSIERHFLVDSPLLLATTTCLHGQTFDINI